MSLHILHDVFIKKLSAEQKHRETRNKIINGESEWVVAERQFMIDLTQKTRKEIGFEPVEESLILRAEREACGHSDYSSKFALYCAEIALTGKLPMIY